MADIALERFKLFAITCVEDKLERQRKAIKPWGRDEYICYITGLIDSYVFANGRRLDVDTRKLLRVDIMVESGVMAEVLV